MSATEPVQLHAPLQARRVELDPDECLDLHLRIREREVVEALRAVPAGRARDDLARTALRIGVLALRHVQGSLDAHSVRTEVDRMLEALKGGLEEHRRSVHERVAETLREYFDPTSGRLSERVDRLTRQDGELATLLRSQVSGDDSALGRTLAAHLGDESPLLRLVDPSNGQGLVQRLREIVTHEVSSQRERILAEFSLDNREGSLARLVSELREHHGKLTGHLDERIEAMVREFSLDEENSALSRLVQRVERAQQQITREFSLDSEETGLARLRREVLGVVEAQSLKIASMEKTVSTELAALSARRAETERSTLRGQQFEDGVAGLVLALAQRSGDLCERTGTRTGLIKNCKRGDLVVELGPEHQARGARIVIEAKEDKSYTLEKARAYLEEARKNRAADHGVFVLSCATAPEGIRPIERVGPDVFVVWDPSEERTDVYVEVALSLARALSTKRADARETALDLEALERAIRAVEKQIDGLELIRTASQTIESSNDKIQDRVRQLTKSLRTAVQSLDDHAIALHRDLS